VCYLSRNLDKHQKAYATVEKEALALATSVRAFTVYFGSSEVTVYTDHSPLQFLAKMANHNQKLLRWSLELQHYNLNVVHRRGRDNLIPDILSRPSQ
jgi:RNase H-like domain found in reverse transcriptase